MKKQERFNINEEYLKNIQELMKKEHKNKNEIINDILYKHFNARDNRLSRKIAQDIENILLFNIKYKDISSDISIEDIYKRCNIINNDKKAYLNEKKKKEVGFYKEIKSIVNKKYFDILIKKFDDSKTHTDKLRILSKEFQKILEIVRTYEKV